MSYGKHDGKKVDGVEIKFSGGTRGERAMKEGETGYLVVAYTVGASVFTNTEKRGLIREQRLTVGGATELPAEMIPDIEHRIRLAAGTPNLDDALAEAEGGEDG